jgi:hypothetical protein
MIKWPHHQEQEEDWPSSEDKRKRWRQLDLENKKGNQNRNIKPTQEPKPNWPKKESNIKEALPVYPAAAAAPPW